MRRIVMVRMGYGALSAVEMEFDSNRLGFYMVLLPHGMFQYGGDNVQSAIMAFLSQRSLTVEVFRESEVVAPLWILSSLMRR